jgi:tetratricopeptide (TPR) repeat protein
MKLFKIFVFWIGLMIILPVSAQNSEECLQDLSIFAEYAKVKNYDEAYGPWLKVREACPSLNVAIFSYGERILKDRIKKATPETRDAETADLIKLYDQWLENFPTRRNVSVSGDIISSKAQAMLDYKTADKMKVYKTFDLAYQTDAKSFNNPKELYNYFKTLYDLYKEGNQGVTMEQLFNKYEEVSEKFEIESINLAKKLDVILKKQEEGTPLSSREVRSKRVYGINSNAIGTFLSNLDAIISKEATCVNLVPLYKRNFEEFKSDAVWLKRAASRMDSKECSDDPFFVTLVEALHTLDPSADSAYYLGILKDKAGDSQEALKYYEESISLQTDPYKKAKILYKIAIKFKSAGRKSSARSYALKALRFQPSMGRAYLMISNLYAGSANDCGETQFNKRAVYWLAAQMAFKAGEVDASIKKLALKTARSYEGRAPSKTEIFTEGNQGATIEFDCWIKSSVKVPEL